MLAHHQISGQAFAALAQGEPGAPAVETLREAQLSKHLLLVKYVAEVWPGPLAERESALAVLTEAQERDPKVIAGLLGEPLTGSWTALATRRLRGSAHSDVPLAAEVGYLAAIAATAAARTGANATLTAYPRGGLVAMPTLGAARLPLPDHAPVRITVRDGAVRLSGGGATVDVPADPNTATDAWLPLRRLRAAAGEQRFTVALDDLNAYRDNHHIPAADRLSPREAARWQELFEGAWSLLAEHAPGHAEELRAGLRSLIPLANTGTGPARSATMRDAFGAFGLTEPESAADLAITMVHEFQHSKLSALLDLVPLYDASGTDTYYAPWRTDPRPIGGLFQGVYAFLGVADAWRLLRAAPSQRRTAEHELALVREQVHAALTALSTSAQLTPDGERFAAGMRAKLDALLAVPVPADVAAQARTALRRNHDQWKRRNNRTN